MTFPLNSSAVINTVFLSALKYLNSSSTAGYSEPYPVTTRSFHPVSRSSALSDSDSCAASSLSNVLA